MLNVKVDYRLGGNPRYYLAEETEKPMMSLPPEIKKCVVFLLYNSKTKKETLAGTAFFVSVSLEEFPEEGIPYLVTAKHIITEIKKNSKDVEKNVLIRINLTSGITRSISTKADQWIYHEDPSVDVAVLKWVPSQKIYDFLAINMRGKTAMAVNEQVIKEENIGIGDEVFLTGLFSKFHGKIKNIPIIRVGNIAMMPEEKIFVGNDLGEIEAYLVESRSIGGLSGSPVFVYLGNMRPKNGTWNLGGDQKLFYLLGLMHGHWDIEEDKIDIVVEDKVKDELNTGIAVVVPASKILEVLDYQEFVEDRKKFEANLKKSFETKQDKSAIIQVHEENKVQSQKERN